MGYQSMLRLHLLKTNDLYGTSDFFSSAAVQFAAHLLNLLISGQFRMSFKIEGQILLPAFQTPENPFPVTATVLATGGSQTSIGRTNNN
jgi:hypothetical protein